MIDSYSFGRIQVDGRTYTSDVIVYPDHVDDSWWRDEGHNLSLEDLRAALQAQPEVLVVGQGESGRMKVRDAVVRQLRQKGIEIFVASTDVAVRRYNELRGKKKVVAALHLTC